MRNNKDRSRFEMAAGALVPVLMLLTSFLAHLQYHRYPFWLAESMLAVTVLLGLALLLGALTLVTDGALATAILAVLLVLLIDFLVPYPAWASPINHWAGPVAVVVAVIAAFIASALLCRLLRPHRGTILGTGSAVLLATIMLLPSDRITYGVTRDAMREPRQDLPPIVHIILDEYIGIEGFPADVPGAAELQNDLRSLYYDYGFLKFGGGFSQYRDTADSLPALLNGRLARQVFGGVVDASGRKWLIENLWFERLSEAGYAIRVYQSDYLDYSAAQNATVDYCYTYPANSVHSLLPVDAPTRTKARLLLETWLDSSFVARVLNSLYLPLLDAFGRSPQARHVFFGSLPSITLFDRLADDLRLWPRGVAFFAHILLPHSSYVFDADCRVRSDASTWLRPRDETLPAPSRNTPESQSERYQLYFQQLRCTQTKLGDLLADMATHGVLDRATVIIHGDHGSRIELNTPATEVVDQLLERDFVDAFSTAFAVRQPGIAAGYKTEMRSIQGLFAEMFLGGEPVSADSGKVFLKPLRPQIGDEMLPWPMPPFVQPQE